MFPATRSYSPRPYKTAHQGPRLTVVRDRLRSGRCPPSGGVHAGADDAHVVARDVDAGPPGRARRKVSPPATSERSTPAAPGVREDLVAYRFRRPCLRIPLGKEKGDLRLEKKSLRYDRYQIFLSEDDLQRWRARLGL